MRPEIIITGGAGFVGHHVVEHLLKSTGSSISTIDSLTYSGSMDRLRDINVFDEKRVACFTRNLCDPIDGGFANELIGAEWILHLAAQSHVDNSIKDPAKCAYNNVMSTVRILDFIRKHSPNTKLIYFSTDEVFGPCMEGTQPYNELARHSPKNPYAASKSAGEQFVTSYVNTYGVKAVIARSMNIFGERQHVEKFVPKTIRTVLSQQHMTIHASPSGKPGSRFWIHARNVANALSFIMDFCRSGDSVEWGESFNIVGEREIDNLTMAQMIAKAVGAELSYKLVDFHSSRPGHDLRYGMSGGKLEAMGWKVPVHIDEAITKTVKWTLNNRRWLNE